MPSSHNLRLTAEVQTDLGDILRLSLEIWGSSQRDVYQVAILDRFDELRSFPSMGRPRNDLFAGCRALTIQQHLAYYVIRADEIVVVRVLHSRRDPANAIRSIDLRD